MEKIITNFISTEIEWVPLNSVQINKDYKNDVLDFLETLEEDDDVQRVYSNVNLGGIWCWLLELIQEFQAQSVFLKMVIKAY